MIADPRPALRPDLLRRDIGHEAVIWSPIRQDPISLDAVARVLLDIIDGHASIAELISDVHEVIGVPREVAAARVHQVVNQLDTAGALTTSMLSSTPERQRELFVNPPST